MEFVSDREYDGMTAAELPVVAKDSSLSFAFIIDRVALTTPEHPVLVVDLQAKPGRTFRVISSELGTVENNLPIANMSFAEFADAAGREGIFRGF